MLVSWLIYISANIPDEYSLGVYFPYWIVILAILGSLIRYTAEKSFTSRFIKQTRGIESIAYRTHEIEYRKYDSRIRIVLQNIISNIFLPGFFVILFWYLLSLGGSPNNIALIIISLFVGFATKDMKRILIDLVGSRTIFRDSEDANQENLPARLSLILSKDKNEVRVGEYTTLRAAIKSTNKSASLENMRVDFFLSNNYARLLQE